MHTRTSLPSPSGILIGSAVFAQRTRVPDIQTTLCATRVAKARIYTVRADDATQ